MTTKVCKDCHKEKEFDEFPKHKQMKDGHLNQCKVCKNDYLRKYGEGNKEKLSEKSKTYYEENREVIKKRVRNHWNDNATEINQKRREKYKIDETYREKVLQHQMLNVAPKDVKR